MEGKNKKRPRRTFSAEFKAEAIRLVRTSGKSLSQVSRDLGLQRHSLAQWLKQADIDSGKGPPEALTTDERAELATLRKENRILREEREILKKATAFFAKENR